MYFNDEELNNKFTEYLEYRKNEGKEINEKEIENVKGLLLRLGNCNRDTMISILGNYMEE